MVVRNLSTLKDCTANWYCAREPLENHPLLARITTEVKASGVEKGHANWQSVTCRPVCIPVSAESSWSHAPSLSPLIHSHLHYKYDLTFPPFYSIRAN